MSRVNRRLLSRVVSVLTDRGTSISSSIPHAGSNTAALAGPSTARISCRVWPQAAQPAVQRHLPANRSMTTSSSVHKGEHYELIKLQLDGKVGIITIDRPKQLNALNTQVMKEVCSAAIELDKDPSVRAIVLTGSGEKAFAAGADIKEMVDIDYPKAYREHLLQGWTMLQLVTKPIIAAVNGYALGGGCEVAMMCDIILASNNASFGQPEIQLGVIPGMGGTQRLVRAIGKSAAMEMILTGARITAEQAQQAGLVSAVYPQDQLMPEALKMANTIASFSPMAVAKAKDCVNRAYEMTLSEGLRYERREFWSSFGLDDQREGMRAFLEKRKPTFKGS